MITKPSMNYPLEDELGFVGGWTHPDFRKRPATLYERMDDANRALRNFRDSIENYKKPYPRIEGFCKKFTLREHSMGYCIMKFQVQAMRKVLFPNEHRRIWEYCPICETKRWYYRLPNYTGLSNEFEVRLTQLNTLFHCTKCHYVSWESELDIQKIKQKSKGGVSGYVDSKAGLRHFMMDMAKYQGVSLIMMYYHRHERDKEKLNVDDFMIHTEHYTGGNGFQCIACKFIYKRKNMAVKHLRNFWSYSNDGWKYGCLQGIRNRDRKLLELAA